MIRVVLATAFSIGALAVGIYTACLAARNRARGHDLDQRQHWCETLAGANELLQVENKGGEWRLLSAEELEITEPEVRPQVRIDH